MRSKAVAARLWSISARSGKNLWARLNSSAQALTAALDQGARTSIATLVNTNDKLRAELPAVLDSLGRTNSSLQHIIDQAGGNFIKLESQLGGRLQEFQHAIESVTNQVAAIRFGCGRGDWRRLIHCQRHGDAATRVGGKRSSARSQPERA